MFKSIQNQAKASLCIPADLQYKIQESAPPGLSTNFVQTCKNLGKALNLSLPNLQKRITKYSCHKEQIITQSSYTKWGFTHKL